MTALSLDAARTILDTAVKTARSQGLSPLAMVVMDARIAVKAGVSEDGASPGRYAIAQAKANGALALGIGTRTLAARMQTNANFFNAIGPVVGGLAPSPGGVLIRDAAGEIVGAVGVSGDTGDNDELCAIAGIKAAGLTADPGAD